MDAINKLKESWTKIDVKPLETDNSDLLMLLSEASSDAGFLDKSFEKHKALCNLLITELEAKNINTESHHLFHINNRYFIAICEDFTSVVYFLAYNIIKNDIGSYAHPHRIYRSRTEKRTRAYTEFIFLDIFVKTYQGILIEPVTFSKSFSDRTIGAISSVARQMGLNVMYKSQLSIEISNPITEDQYDKLVETDFLESFSFDDYKKAIESTYQQFLEEPGRMIAEMGLEHYILTLKDFRTDLSLNNRHDNIYWQYVLKLEWSKIDLQTIQTDNSQIKQGLINLLKTVKENPKLLNEAAYKENNYELIDLIEMLICTNNGTIYNRKLYHINDSFFIGIDHKEKNINYILSYEITTDNLESYASPIAVYKSPMAGNHNYTEFIFIDIFLKQFTGINITHNLFCESFDSQTLAYIMSTAFYFSCFLRVVSKIHQTDRKFNNAPFSISRLAEDNDIFPQGMLNPEYKISITRRAIENDHDKLIDQDSLKDSSFNDKYKAAAQNAYEYILAERNRLVAEMGYEQYALATKYFKEVLGVDFSY